VAGDDPRASDLESAFFYSPRDLGGAAPKPMPVAVRRRSSGSRVQADVDSPVIPAISVLLVTTPSAGGWFLGELLARVDGVGRAEELFDPGQIDVRGHRWGLSPDLPNFAEEYLNEAIAAGTSSRGVLVAEVHWPHFAWMLDAMRSVALTDPSESDAHVVECWLPNPKFVHVWRRDRCRQAVGWYRRVIESERASAVRSFGDCTLADDLDRIGAFEDRLTEHNRFWARWIRDHQISSLEVVYEDLLARPQETVGRVLEFMGLDGVSLSLDVLPVGDDPESEAVVTAYIKRRQAIAPSGR
jgi:LPS sulfotransferase NodH